VDKLVSGLPFASKKASDISSFLPGPS